MAKGDWDKDEWDGCYPSNWKGLIVAEAMAHPAKFSSRLTRRIYAHLVTERWVKAGDAVLDPFGGVALGALDAMRTGLNWYGVELEPRFVKLAQANIELWNARFGRLPRWGSAQIAQGDSRKLREVLGEVSGVRCQVSSPPYAESIQTKERGSGIDYSKSKTGGKGGTVGREAIAKGYGSTPGNLANMKAAVSSPPYDEARVGKESGQGQCGNGDQYGDAPGQLGGADDFWMAARAIVEQVYETLEAGGHAVWVVKDYVKGGERVPFCDQWRQLCEAVGFVTLHEHHANLVRNKRVQHTLEGGSVTLQAESKSFFRRLAEKKGSPRIDWETVYCMVKGEQR